VAGTYDKAVEATKLLKAHGVRVGINSVVTPWNITVLPQFIEELRSQVDFVQVQPIHPYPPPAEKTPPEEAVAGFIDYLLRLKRSDPGFLGVPTEFIKGFGAFFRGEAPKICHAGELYVGINPSGKLLACPARSDIVLGDTLSGSISNILKEKQYSQEGWRKVSSCRGCWLECTVGVSMVLENPLKEVSHLISLWTSRKD
jgi:MoaA/NifB/PqqE/SkfB family radical SAM enzyme